MNIMIDLTVNNVKKKLERLLKISKKEGAVKIKQKDGGIFTLRPDNKNASPLDVEGIDIAISTDEIIEIIRESRKQK